MLMPGDRSHSTVSRSGSGYGRGLSRSALTTLKTAVFAPIPIASDATITTVRPAVRLNVRRAYRRSCRKSVIARLGAGINERHRLNLPRTPLTRDVAALGRPGTGATTKARDSGRGPPHS